MTLDKNIRKIVYFDRETINNALQRKNDGFLERVQARNSSTALDIDVNTKSDISTYLGVPFLGRLKFLINGRIELRYLHEWDSRTTVTSTDISLFRCIESDLVSFSNVQLNDVKNSLTSFRIAATFLKLVKNNNQEINVREAADLLTSMEGYDLYDIGECRYVRFNQNAYLSNYKRNDIAMAVLDLYCVKVGEYEQSNFDFIEKLNRMQSLFDVSDTQKTTLGEMFFEQSESVESLHAGERMDSKTKQIALYDVLCAYVSEQ